MFGRFGRFVRSAAPPSRASPGRPRRSFLGVRSVAGQVLLLQLVVVVLLIAAAVGTLVLEARGENTREARDRSMAVAETFAHAPGTAAAMTSAEPSEVLQPRAEQIRKQTGVDLIVAYSPEGIRYTHPDPDLIGEPVLGSGEVPKQAHTQIDETTEGLSVLSLVPVTTADGSTVGTVGVGITVESVSTVVNRQLPALLGGAAIVLALGTAGSALVGRRLRRQTHNLDPAEMARMYEHHDAVLHAAREGVLIVGEDGRLLLANDETRRLLGLPADAEGRSITELGLDEGLVALLTSGRSPTDELHAAGERLLAVSVRPTGPYGGLPGSVATLRDTTELEALAVRAEAARTRLKLLYDASVRIGTTLDVVRTAVELTEAAVPRFSDFASVDLLDPVLRGEEPVGLEMRRIALSGIRDDHPLYPLGRLISLAPNTLQAFGFASGRTVLEPELPAFSGWQEQDPALAEVIVGYGIHSLITVPVRARGIILGMASFWRSEKPEPFDEEDVSLVEELVALAAVSIDNARRFTREHTTAVTLQHSLLPSGLPEQDALEVAHRYLPAKAVGGDWFDVIPLPGARVALVVGDVTGHGLQAVATMGRLRTGIHNFAALDMAPDELLAGLDDLVIRIDENQPAVGDSAQITGATCLYAVYDAVTGRCTLARAGHPGPAVIRPDGTVDFPEIPASPPLGLGGLPFETAELQLPAGSRLVLFTDGLITGLDRDIDTGLDRLRGALSGVGAERSPEAICQSVVGTMLPAERSDDIALLVARTRLLDPGQVAHWEVPNDPAEVGRVRASCARQLEEWGLDVVRFTTELILSELITNAIRYGSEPIRVRLLHDRSLICEVSDGSSTSPHLRRAATTDEGGRGLFLVAQMAKRWGTRHTADGKIIWAEQVLHPGSADSADGAGKPVQEAGLPTLWDDVPAL
ncbi:SpoIIE family protein phosphatase [Streptomyces sp. A3M-1-3]|uniref:SpoIIE family protein phosphatase n=1 Tax=Streptomyces sp. A3M-1-3 TaxID=2962044 RepID=UPI0020B6BC1A|nr:SpoIIE family protein phosphatase [Streptomyces sp. A3M-1-3]